MVSAVLAISEYFLNAAIFPDRVLRGLVGDETKREGEIGLLALPVPVHADRQQYSLLEQRATTPVQGPLLGSAEEATLSEVHAEDALARLLVLELDV